MLELAAFIARLTGMVGRASRDLSEVAAKHRECQSEYLDDISRTLASAGTAVGKGHDITKQLATLRYCLTEIESVLRLGDPDYLMSVSDKTAERLCAQLDLAVSATEIARREESPQISRKNGARAENCGIRS